jgi:hypothetical protein
MCGLNKGQLRRVQTIQNGCARFLKGTKAFESVTPKLHELHWLPVAFRIQFKLSVMGHNIIYEQSYPPYIKNSVTLKSPLRFTRSSLSPTFEVPKFNLTSAGNRSVFYNIAMSWNSLPPDLQVITSLKCFKKQLKTLLFKRAFN